eukprot:ctg_666.g363
MLESSRVVGRCGRMSHDDANFHVFYYLVVGALRGSPTEYRYLYAADAGRGDPASANTRTANAELHAAELRTRYHEVLAAMQALELPVEDIMRLLLAILLLGNIEFGSDDGDGSDLDGCYVRRLDVAAQVAELLEVDLTRLEEALVSRTISVRGEHFRRRHSVEEAEEARDALAKVLYRAVFDAIVTGIDRQLKQPQTPTEAEVEDEDEEGYIFLLDQTGFESGEFNSLEQLLINYGNEKLQEQFGDNVAVARWISWRARADAASAVTLDVSDEARLRTARQFLSVPRVRRDDTEFTVHHFAGDVTYGVRDLVKKNRDSLPVALVDVMSVSRWRFLAELMEDVDTQRNVPSPVRGNRVAHHLVGVSAADRRTDDHPPRLQAALHPLHQTEHRETSASVDGAVRVGPAAAQWRVGVCAFAAVGPAGALPVAGVLSAVSGAVCRRLVAVAREPVCRNRHTGHASGGYRGDVAPRAERRRPSGERHAGRGDGPFRGA